MSWKRAGIAMLVVIPLILLFTFGLRRGDPRLIPSPLVDRPAPDFALPVMALSGPTPEGEDVTGDTVRLTDLRGDIVVLNFFASWCVPCRVEHRALQRVARRYEDRNVRFFGVVYNDEPPAVRSYIRQLGGQRYPALLDPGQRVAIDYGLVGVPETFFIAPDGTVRRKVFSAVDETLLVTEIEAMLAEQPAADAGSGEEVGR
ncbi:MAG: redoxin domain-containing protein [Gemmatimonadetes bacterium]|nr:TlpA family protein disulfide reductase [Gemmatimonadota bacterium]NIQ53514.1 TlpA family protein disulfide reductase [Gemmatimonadota bacterium]NIU73656.1 redoxin domain-containing protein [Gammaproteobacteria bacterium]NIX43834.1 redoxin domain-containing protein [Gemmatimonadota bacterium]NIY08038.1 redoxin domain-containing protein [Gemmatimonadota bacterium]